VVAKALVVAVCYLPLLEDSKFLNEERQ